MHLLTHTWYHELKRNASSVFYFACHHKWHLPLFNFLRNLSLQTTFVRGACAKSVHADLCRCLIICCWRDLQCIVGYKSPKRES
ncbi:hypothetical protein FKM82_005769 [Ascaphus truei]